MMVRLMRMIPPLVSTEVSSLLHGSIGTHGTSDTDGLIAAFDYSVHSVTHHLHFLQILKNALFIFTKFVWQ
jgi:hypothetical protein